MAYPSRKTVYVTNQPTSVNPFLQFNDDWKVKLCDCCQDMPQFCYAYWCWYCLLCSLANRINESKTSCFCVPNILLTYRMKVRSALRIEGDACRDCCVVTCCPFCAALQMANELDNRGIP